VHGDGRLARSAFLVAHNNHSSGRRATLIFNRHEIALGENGDIKRRLVAQLALILWISATVSFN
jgi:hypothetical protein